MSRNRKILIAAAAAVIAIAIAALGTQRASAATGPQPSMHGAAATATASGPVYYRWYPNRAYCLTDPGDSVANGTPAVLAECHTNTPGQQLHWSYRGNVGGIDYWWIVTDKNMCFTDPSGGGPGTQIVVWGCQNRGWFWWSDSADSRGQPMWWDDTANSQAISLKNSDPNLGVIQAENPHTFPLPYDTDQEWWATDAAGNCYLCGP